MSRLLRSAALASAAALVLVACGGGGSGGTAPPPSSTTGTIRITVSGLPSDVPAPSITVTGPGGFTQQVNGSQTLTGLAPGSYLVLPARATDRQVGYAAGGSAPTVVAGATAEATVTYAPRILARALVNRPDSVTASRIKLLYVLPSDGVDRGLDTNGTILRVVSSGQRWLASQAGGRHVRYDTNDGGFDIAFVRAPRTDAAYFGYGVFIRDSLEKDLIAAGFTTANVRYLAFYDGRHQTVCGSSAQPPLLNGTLAALYLRGLPTSTVPCAGNPFAASPTAAPGYWEFVAQHELFHLLGHVSTGAPNFVAGGHVGNDPTDLMYAGSQPWRPAALDVARTNYYSTGTLGGGLANFNTSPFTIAP